MSGENLNDIPTAKVIVFVIWFYMQYTGWSVEETVLVGIFPIIMSILFYWYQCVFHQLLSDMFGPFYEKIALFLSQNDYIEVRVIEVSYKYRARFQSNLWWFFRFSHFR